METQPWSRSQTRRVEKSSRETQIESKRSSWARMVIGRVTMIEAVVTLRRVGTAEVTVVMV